MCSGDVRALMNAKKKEILRSLRDLAIFETETCGVNENLGAPRIWKCMFLRAVAQRSRR